MSLVTRFFVVLAVVVAAVWATNAAAWPLSKSDAQQVQRVVAMQLEAFAQNDADRAFETATPALRDAIGNSSRFLALVRGIYPMIYRPASVIFHNPEQDEDNAVQLVEIIDDESKSWLALFALERQPDASWRIGGCAVTENHWQRT
jgi:hypothetical protein